MSRGGQGGGSSSVGLHLGCIKPSMADGRPRITVTSARTATASLVARRGEGVDRRAPHQGPLAGERLAREVSERRVERRVELPPPPVEAAVETVSAAEVLANVAEYGPNYVLPQAAESKTARRKRLRVDAAARIAGHAVVETGTHVEILGEQRWWPGTITGREEGSDGRLVHAVEYDGYPDQDFWLNLEEETWRRVTLGAGGAAPTSGEDSDGEGSDEFKFCSFLVLLGPSVNRPQKRARRRGERRSRRRVAPCRLYAAYSIIVLQIHTPRLYPGYPLERTDPHCHWAPDARG